MRTGIASFFFAKCHLWNTLLCSHFPTFVDIINSPMVQIQQDILSISLSYWFCYFRRFKVFITFTFWGWSFRWWGKVEGIYLIGSRLRSTSLSFFCRQIASFHFPDYEVQKTHKVHTDCQITSICDSFHFCQIEFFFSTLPKISISIQNWEKWLRFSVSLSLHLMKLRQNEKWIKGPETSVWFYF